MSTIKRSISTHVLDTSTGKPARDLAILLERKRDAGWEKVGAASTNADGRAPELVPGGAKIAPGVYRLTFETGAYFKAGGVQGFYPSVTVLFELRDDSHHHVPLLLSPFGYSTYRGS